MKPSVVVAAVADKGPLVLSEFLHWTGALSAGAIDVCYIFVDDCNEPTSSALLTAFAQEHEGTVVVPATSAQGAEPLIPQGVDGPVWRRAELKNYLLNEARASGVSHLLLVDSSLLLPPPLLDHLLSLGKDIVSEVFWTEWAAVGPSLPSVWQCDDYAFYPSELARASDVAKSAAGQQFLRDLHQPGTYEVGGLSGCTLLSRDAFGSGASFTPLPNVSFWGDDRHFCIRAAALGLRLWADTHLPLLHLYRPEDLGQALHFRARWQPDSRAA